MDKPVTNLNKKDYDRCDSQDSPPAAEKRFVKAKVKVQQVGPESILESISLGVFTVDQDRRITSFNRAAEVITGIPRLQAIGRYCSDIFCANICGHNCPMQRTLATRNPTLNVEAFILNSEGYQVPVTVSTTLLRDHNDVIIGGAETFQDLRLSSGTVQKTEIQLYASVLVSRNQAMGSIIKILPQIAATQNPILLEGESGSGKELLARTIHALSSQRKKPFIALNCCTLSSSFLDTKLFGRQKKSLEGKRKGQTGRLGVAKGSTIFFEQINRINKSLQARLVTILPQKSGNEWAKSSMRLIASTERSLSSLVNDGLFCKTLSDRISCIVLKLPPLRKRKEDIPFLIDHFISHFNQLYNKSIKGVSQETMALLMAHNYPGNIRELKNIVEHATAQCPGSHITPLHLPETSRIPPADTFQSLSMEVAVQAVEVQTIISALKRNNYNRKAAAQELGIHKSTFFRKIKHLGIVLPQLDGRFRLSVNDN